MRLFVVGATGRTGQLVVEQAIKRAHMVTVIVRKTGAVPAHDNLRIVIGDPLRIDDLTPHLAGHDVVISCLGQRSRMDNTLLRDGTTAMLEAMHRSGVHRYLVVSQGLLYPSRSPIIWLLRKILARHVADSTAMEELVTASNVDWTIVRPPRLRNGGALRGYRLQVGARPSGAQSMQRADLAVCLVDEAENAEYIQTVVGVTSL
ncbi:MAG TPA: NAD(P)H-binding protein [Rhodanobacter sp.]|nr:NAD(P)H-binding protein [Rhodanobacter sp.]